METTVEPVVVGALRLDVERPRSAEALLDEEEFERDEFLPYWAELWPAGLALARHVTTTDIAGLATLELGCGLGLPSLAAAAHEARVLATDWAIDAIELLRRNAARNGLELEAALLDWREPDALGGLRFELVLAADVLYEARNAEPLLACLEKALTEDGRVLIADPGRRHADVLLEAARRSGWSHETLTRPEIPDGHVHVLRR